jgi:hypothetical protein
MVKVYMEDRRTIHAELIASFINEETYMVCLPALEALAKANRSIITESLEE